MYCIIQTLLVTYGKMKHRMFQSVLLHRDDGKAGVLVLSSSNVHWWWWWCARALQGFKPDPE